MKKEEVEIYSDVSNMAVMRHPGRRYPGSLIQGDSLHSLLRDAINVKRQIESGNIQAASEDLDEIIEILTWRLEHYKNVMKENGLELPFIE